MKKGLLFLIVVFLFSFDSYSQRFSKAEFRDTKTWTLSVGVNAVGSLGTQNPFKDLGKFEFKQPLAVAVQYRWSKSFSLEQDFTLNKFSTSSTIDNGSVPDDFNFFSTNTYFKYYFSENIFPNALWLDLYTGGGLGVFKVNDVNGSFNLVLGGIAWITPSIGVSLQGVGKFAFNHRNERYATNHIQYMLYTIFRL